MTALVNHQLLLASRPEGEPTPANFRLVEAAVPDIGDGQVLVRHHYLSLTRTCAGAWTRARVTPLRSRSMK